MAPPSVNYDIQLFLLDLKVQVKSSIVYKENDTLNPEFSIRFVSLPCVVLFLMSHHCLSSLQVSFAFVCNTKKADINDTNSKLPDSNIRRTL